MPDPGKATDLAEFIGLLGELRVWAGTPSYRTLARQAGPFMKPPRVVSPFTVVDAFKAGRRRLDLDLVVAIVRALGVDEAGVARWREACVKVHGLTKIGGPVGVFGQLPAELATFTGREDELTRLIETATRRHGSGNARTVVISAIEGMAGVGKTQLAVRVAHELVRAGHFTDVQLHVNLRGFDPDVPAADPAAVLEAFLRQLGVPAQQVPVSREERAAMYRDRLRERGALILLDNAADEDQVHDLIPAGPTCLVLITSRRSLAGLDGVTPHLIGTFTDTESLDLLMRIAGRDRVTAELDAATRIVEYCDRLPLALALTAARLRSRPAWSLAEHADRMQAGRLEAIRAGGRAIRPVFELSYRDLAGPLRRVFRLLGHHPGPDFTPAILAALADIPDHEAEGALEQLQDENLIRQNTPGRYELHDLLRAYAAELADADPEPDPTAPVARLATWAVATGYAAALAIGTPPLSGFPPEEAARPMRFAGYDQGLTWFENERQNLAAIQNSAARAGLHRRVWQLASVQKEFCIVRNQFDDLLAAQQLAVVAAQAAGDQAAEALMLSGLGSVYWRMDRLDEAEDSCLRALEIYRTVVDPSGEGSALIDYGTVQCQRGNQEYSVALFTQALGLLHGEDTRRARATALLNRGVLQQRLGRLAQAFADTHQALAIYRQLAYRRGEVLAIGNLAWFHLVDTDLDSAFALYREQQHLALLLSDTFLQADALFGTGETHATAGHFDHARHAWQQALHLFEKLSHPRAAVAQQRLDTTENEWPIPWTPTDWAAPQPTGCGEP
ncbi:tetratricopeptide repeat protein [Actinoallomurus soli]|uniref:tetratricopeptide repeat protein n=1 Tax=Actinoallomurus soli TaxID=2952535 RepID=UPI002093D435|nr:tetratricopeptide repeat protein [Actinoallomurus soli]MCO5974854.1 tetratricopeptide repeat protein [Actinoallomurus soli]